MYKIVTSFVFSILVLSLLSCKKDLNFTISGQILDASFGKSIDGCTVTLEQVSADGSEKTTLVAEKTIGFDGYFEFVFKREKALKYFLSISKDNYFPIKEEIGFDELDVKTPKIGLYEMFAKSWIKFKIVNQAPINNSDVYTLFFNKLKVCEECCGIEKYTIQGSDSTFICLFDGNATYNFDFVRSSPFEQSSFSITTIAFDTLEVIKAF